MASSPRLLEAPSSLGSMHGASPVALASLWRHLVSVGPIRRLGEGQPLLGAPAASLISDIKPSLGAKSVAPQLAAHAALAWESPITV